MEQGLFEEKEEAKFCIEEEEEEEVNLVADWDQRRCQLLPNRIRSLFSGCVWSIQHGSWLYYENLIFNYSLLISMGLQIFLAVFVEIVDPDAFRKHFSHVGLIIAVFIIELLQASILLFTTIQIFSRMKRGYVNPNVLLHMFLSNIVAFAGLYTLCYSTSRDTFQVNAYHETLHNESSAFDTFFLFLYYSISTMSSCGLGDILPMHWFSQLLTFTQMLFAMCYFTGIFVLGLNHFIFHQCISGIPPNTRPGYLQHISTFDHWIDRVLPCLAGFRCFITECMLATVVAVESFGLLILYSTGNNVLDEASRGNDTVVSIVLCVHIVQFIIGTSIFLHISSMVSSSRFKISLSFVVQGFLSTVVVFSGFFFTVFTLSGPSSFFILSDQSSSPQAFRIMYLFVYFSISTQTSTGLGDIYPANGVAWFTVSVHILVSIMYSVVIVGLGLSHWSHNLLKTVQKTPVLPEPDVLGAVA